MSHRPIHLVNGIDEGVRRMSFSDFWIAYPRRVGKIDAEKAYNQAVKGGTAPDRIDGAAKMFSAICAKERREKQFIPHPATWIRRGSFLDDDVRIPDLADKTAEPIKAHPSWNGTSAAMIAEFGAAPFTAWFGDAEFVPGDQPRVIAATAFKKGWIDERYGVRLRRVLGDGVIVEMKT